MILARCKTNHLTNPLGFDLGRPVFSWVSEQARGLRQQAARVRVARDPGMQDILADSGRREDISSLAYAPMLPLAPRTRYWWDVTVWDETGDTATSAPNWFETGKMGEAWQGRWIRAPFEGHPELFQDFKLHSAVASARLYICGLGLYEASLNGTKVGEEYLTPHCTSYQHRIQVQTYDVTALLGSENRLSVLLGRGWYHGRFGFGDKQDKIYGPHMQLIAELHVTYTDGSETVIATDDTWHCRVSPVCTSSIYDGETWDARLETADREVLPVVPADAPAGDLVDRLSPMVTKQQMRKPELLHTPAGELVLDFGQVVTGWVEFTANVHAGREIRLDYGELLQDDNFYNENLRTAEAAYTYIADGAQHRVRPHFTFYGFRFVRVTGLTEEEIAAADFTAWAVYSALEETASIQTGNPKVDRLILNALWSQRDNFLDVPTDCPQRDERMGWTGDAQIFASTACFRMDTAAFYRKYLRDMWAEQRDLNGAVPFVVPDVLRARDEAAGRQPGDRGAAGGFGACAWGDAATVIPWTLYQYYGDRYLLEETYPNMKAWTDWIREQDETRCGARRLWTCGFHFGDWLALDNPDKESRFGGTENAYVATAYYYWSASLTAKAAAALGKAEDAKAYADLAQEIKTAFQREYFTPTGRLAVPTQTAHALAIAFDLVPKAYKARTAADLKARLDAKQIHLDTGFVGTGVLADALSRVGLGDYAVTLLLNEDFPSWLYEVNMGATTIWERWNSVLPDGKVSGTGMNSMNHYAYGCIVGWIFRALAGLQMPEDSFGWKRADICPHTDRRFPGISAVWDSPAGRYISKWAWEGDGVRYEITVPFDCEAAFTLPEGQEITACNGAPAQGGTLPLPCGTWKITARIG